MKLQPLSICFVAPMAYPVLSGSRALAVVGGAEVQQCLLAVELARRGYRVSMASMDYGQREGDTIRGVQLLRMHAPDAGVPVLRFLHPRLTGVWRAMKRADADVYYQRGAGMLTGVVTGFAKRYGRRSIFAAAHDDDFGPTPNIRYARDRTLYRYGIRHADSVVVQTEYQRSRCAQVFGREATRIDSCYAQGGEPAVHDGVILWVATAKRHKRPHLFLELARRLPQHRFRLVGGPAQGAAEQAYFEQLQAEAASLPHVELCGFVPFVDIDRHFDGASVFVNTSIGEGFPNTFLQAWSRGIPTLSFFDPMTSLDQRPVGAVVPDLDAMTLELRRLKSDALYWQGEGERARTLVQRQYSLATVVDAYERLLASLMTTRPAHRGAMPAGATIDFGRATDRTRQ
jgi:glycosyltransferase involved in cell wall biosynthesis